MASRAPRLTVLGGLALFLLAACGGGGGGGGDGPPVVPPLTVGEVPPDFSLPDVNAASPTFGTNVAPSQWASYVTPWYFGWAT